MKMQRPQGSTPPGAAKSLLEDFSNYHRGSPEHRVAAPSNVEEARAVVLGAYRDGTPIRFRGAGHSMNGSSLPAAGELLITTENLTRYSFDEDNSVRVGAGVLMWDLHTMLKTHGFDLLVCNDGGAPAPTVGGYIAAGGIGENTSLFGGFWESVLEITFITGTGEVVTCHPADEIFQWLFGAMGQLGFVVEAKLQIFAPELLEGLPQKAVYPMGVSGVVEGSVAAWDRYSWFTLFVPYKDSDRAMNQLGELCVKYQHCWRPLSNYVYPVRFGAFNPPLIYPIQKGFVAEGIWGSPLDGLHFDFEAMRALEADFMHLSMTEPGYRRYIQTELLLDKTDYRRYFGEEVFSKFVELKRTYDPAMLMGRGQVF